MNMKKHNHIQSRFIYEARKDLRCRDEDKQIKVLVELKKRSGGFLEQVLSTEDHSENGLFLIIDRSKHSHKMGDYIEIGLVIDKQPVLKCGVIRRICDRGLGVELFDLEKIDME